MLKLIRPQDAQLGMFIIGFEGSWADHPFWRTNFLLNKPGDLARLRASAVSGVLIDDAKSGMDASGEVGKPGAVQRPTDTAEPRPSAGFDQQRLAEMTVRNCRRAMGRLFGSARMGRTPDPRIALSVTQGILTSLTGSSTALIGLTRIKSTDAYTYLHSIAVSALMLRFGRYLELETEDLQLLGMAGLLHDLGKVSIPASVLLKPSGLTEQERELIQAHPGEGHRILSAHPDMPDMILDICRHHHERLDGTGYPDRIAGEEISRPVRLSTICDVYDAVTSIRPYRKAWTPQEALTRMFEWEGHLDMPLLADFARCLGYEETIPLDLRIEMPDAQASKAVNGYSDPRP
ncbi:HD-GYP domain-containing protein [Aureimonas sp. AU20]|uniref:HD-GYP domain-containing protein n=1 Tax=Aureimonas sp. AU20 TaxID=1349819 RepID=UPI000721241A|nr:HD-GYP domain-containing protein [Aureimonas sp. AU20]ALN71800.1 hypothetical protein M673_03685 [Aureimonas sp. AU20]